jgi:hypothetical protein
MSRAKPTETEFVIQVCVSAIFVVAGFALLLRARNRPPRWRRYGSGLSSGSGFTELLA